MVALTYENLKRNGYLIVDSLGDVFTMIDAMPSNELLMYHLHKKKRKYVMHIATKDERRRVYLQFCREKNANSRERYTRMRFTRKVQAFDEDDKIIVEDLPGRT